MPSQNGGTNRPVIAAMFRGPGPAAVLLPNSTGYKSHDFTKNKAPAYSFGFKPKWKASENSPGPAYLIPEKLTRVGADGSPRYTLKGRTNLQTSFRTPGPGRLFYLHLFRLNPLSYATLTGCVPDVSQIRNQFLINFSIRLRDQA